MNSNFTHNIANRPFRFLASWMEHCDFDNFLNNTWDKSCGLHDNLKHFTIKVKAWNKIVFRNIFYGKKGIKARFSGIQIAQEKSFSTRLDNLERKHRYDLQMVLKQEETLWRQKLRIQCICEGHKIHVSSICLLLSDVKETKLRDLRLTILGVMMLVL